MNQCFEIVVSRTPPRSFDSKFYKALRKIENFTQNITENKQRRNNL